MKIDIAIKLINEAKANGATEVYVDCYEDICFSSPEGSKGFIDDSIEGQESYIPKTEYVSSL